MSVVADSPHTLADLDTWSFAGTALAVVGQPVGHSLSPVIHNAALADLARAQPKFADWRYFKFDVAPADLPRALQRFHHHRFHGLNLTVPHKSIAVEHLLTTDNIVRAAGAANTLSAIPGGWRGANTDGYGLVKALEEQLGLRLAKTPVILLGAGGAARGAAVRCLDSSFDSPCSELWIGNRTQATLTALLTELGEDRYCDLHGFDLAHPPANLPRDAIVINATSLGLKTTDAAPIDLARIPRPAAVYDMIYRPAATALLRQAAELGIPHANGLSMLIHQGARSLEIWTGAKAPVAVMQAAALAGLQSS